MLLANLYEKFIYSITWILYIWNWSANCTFHQIIILNFTTPAMNLEILNFWESFVLGDKVFTLQDTSTIPEDLYTHHRFYMSQHTLLFVARVWNSIKIEPTNLGIFSFTDIIQSHLFTWLCYTTTVVEWKSTIGEDRYSSCWAIEAQHDYCLYTYFTKPYIRFVIAVINAR